MQRVVLCLLAIIAIGQAFRVPATYSGATNAVRWEAAPIHVLHSGNNEGRVVDQVIRFPRAFATPPKILLTAWLLDW